MPRIYTGSSDPLDFCQDCFPSESDAEEQYGKGEWEGPDGRGNCFGYEAEHPPYQGIGYTCVKCGVKLTEADDWRME